MAFCILIPPLVLIILTRWLPVSTTFMILSGFSSQTIIEKMILKSYFRVRVAFVFFALGLHLIARRFESEESNFQIRKKKKPKRAGLVAQMVVHWSLLWSKWLIRIFCPIFMCICRGNWHSLTDAIFIHLFGLNAHLFKIPRRENPGNCPLQANTPAYPFSHFYNLTYAHRYWFSLYS